METKVYSENNPQPSAMHSAGRPCYLLLATLQNAGKVSDF